MRLDDTGAAGPGGTFAGRRVCLVGNGPGARRSAGYDVDGHEVVVRFNDPVEGRHLGRRTDIYVTTFRSEVRTSPRAMLERGARLATLSEASVPPELAGRVDIWASAASTLEAQLGCWPSSGLAAFFEAVRQRARLITIIGMDLAPPLVAGAGTGAAPSLFHNFVGERRVFAELVRKAQAWGIGLALPPELRDALPGARGAPPSDAQFDALLAANLADTLERLRADGACAEGREQFAKVVETVASVLSEEFRIVRHTPASMASDSTCRALERHLFLPRGKGTRGHPWWLYDASLGGEVERLATALRRAARAFSWTAPGDLERSLRSRFGCDGALSVLGVGVEGVVLTDGARVFKCLTDPDNWLAHEEMLRTLPSRARTRALPVVLEVGRAGDVLVVASQFEPFAPFERAGTGDWRAFFDGMAAAGLCARNVKPSNFVRVAGAVRFIDLGNSLRPWSRAEAEEMALRCHLLDRFGSRSDLVDLMSACSRDRSHPALEGLDAFLSGVGLDTPPAPAPSAPEPSNRTARDGLPFSLLIKLCAMDHELGPDFVEHLARTLRATDALGEVLVVVDSREDGFLRQFAVPNRARLLTRLRGLAAAGVVDRIVEVPSAIDAIRATYERWFGARALERGVPDSHADNGQQLFATLFGIDECRHDRIIALDGDLLAWKRPDFAGWRDRLESAFRDHPSAAFVSPPICLAKASPPTHADDRGPYRPCPRASVIARERLRALLPLETPTDAHGRLPPWHRRLHGAVGVVRLHDDDWGLVHVPNFPCKQEPRHVLQILDRIEAGWLPREQLGAQDLAWDADWDGPPRDEGFVFVVAGRNVVAPRIARCLESLRRQKGPSWGAIVVDDASDDHTHATLLAEIAGDTRFTLLRNARRSGYLPNLMRAVGRVMRRSDSVAVLVDLDDCLIGDGVLERLAREYDRGCDLTVGSMFRTDKPWHLPSDFANPRSHRGNVWQHLRTFRKALFDRLPAELLLRDDGTWFEVSNDWAYMVPLVELSSRPTWIKDVLYYYDPVPKSEERRRRQASEIDEILRRPAVHGPQP